MLRVETPLATTDDSESGRHGSWSQQVLRRLLRNLNARIGLALLALVTALAILAPLIARYPPDALNFSALNQEPTGSHWFGTDYLGRDIWARTLYGGRISLPAGLGVVAIGLGIGTPLGIIAGYARGSIDDLIMRLMDVLLAIPGVLLAIGLATLLGPGLTSVIVAVGIAGIPGYARLARGSTLSATETEYVAAARAVGAGRGGLMFRHILVNIIDPLIVLGTLNLGGAILVTAALSFLGIGTQLPTADWGNMLSEGYDHMFQSWAQAIFPGLAIVISVLGINLLGDGLSDALNGQL